MKLVRTADEYDVFECTACEKRGRYPVDGNAMMICDQEMAQNPTPSKEK
jgi:hypothetical protein